MYIGVPTPFIVSRVYRWHIYRNITTHVLFIVLGVLFIVIDVLFIVLDVIFIV